MGAVDVVVQVEAPPSVASGLQRVGRAGHQVGATSRGVFFPNHRGDLIESAVVVERMRQGAIEEVAELRNPLDVLAQQIVAMVAMEEHQGRRAVRAGPAGRQLPRAAAQRVRGRAGHAQRPLPERGLRRAAAAAGLAAGHRVADRPPGGAAAGGDLRRDHSRPRPVRGVPGRRGQRLGSACARPPGRRAGRGDGLRDAGRRRLHPGHDQLAGRADHPRPGAGLPRPGQSGPAALLEGRLPGPPARARAGPSAASSARSARCAPGAGARPG